MYVCMMCGCWLSWGVEVGIGVRVRVGVAEEVEI